MKKKILLTFLVTMLCIIAFGVIIVSAATTLNVSSVAELQSAHNYSNNMDTTWVYTHHNEVDSLEITFSSDTATESNYDYIYIIDGNGNQIKKESGTTLAGKTVTVTGNVVKIRLTSDSSNTKYGFRVTSINAIVEAGPIKKLKGYVSSESSMIFTFPVPAEATSVILEYSTDEITWNAATTAEPLTAESNQVTVTGLEFEVEYWFRLNVTGGKHEGVSNIVSHTIGYSPEEDFEFSDGVINKYIGNDSFVLLPSVIDGLTVEKIGWRAFYGCSGIKSISLPDGLKEIGTYAFKGCTGLTSVSIPNSVTNIGDSAFYGCTGLTSVIISENTTTIDNSAFNGCSGLTSITIPDNVTTIGSGAFYRCTGLTDLTIGKNVSSIGSKTFGDCYYLTLIKWNAKNVRDFVGDPDFSGSSEAFFDAGKSGCGITVVFGDEVESIPSWAFSSYRSYSSGMGSSFDFNTAKITKVIMGKSLKYVGTRAFYNCSDLEEIVFNDNFKHIGGAAFMQCENLESITLPEALTTIDSGAFRYCSSLKEIKWNAKNMDSDSLGTFVFSDCGNDELGISITFGENVETIPDKLFNREESGYVSPTIKSVVFGSNMKVIPEKLCSGMSSLTSITIPNKAINIGDSAFENCGYYNNSENWDNGYLYINNHLISTDKTMATAVVREGTITIAGGAFKENTELLKITIPDTVETISDYAFYNCKNLLKITIPENVSYIGKYAFTGCSSIVKINIPSKVEKIGYCAFSGCHSLEGVYITDINAWCKIEFLDGENSATYSNPLCSAGNLYINNELVESITVGTDITKLNDYVFTGCNNIKNVNLHEMLTSIGDYAFAYCDNLTNINIPASVTTIGNYVFYGCDNLTSINIPASVTTIDNYAFAYCENLTNINIPASVTTIGNYAFANCDNLTSIDILANVRTFGDYAFAYCDNLTSINIPVSVTTIGNYVFYDCDNLRKIHITDLSAWCKISFNNYEQNPLSCGANLYLNGELLEELVIPEDVTVLNNYAFYNYDDLKSIVLGDNIEKIEEKVFYDCDGLKCVVIPENIFYIKNNSFNGCTNIKYVFCKGSQAVWDDMLIYPGNEPLNNATIICNAKEKTYKFETNSASRLRDITTYCIAEAPKPYNDKQVLLGWYDNNELSGDAIVFPYYGDATTLYAKWAKRTGDSFNDAFYLKENEKITNTVDAWDYVYYEFSPCFSGEYKFYINGSSDVNIKLYNQHHDSIAYSNNGEYYSYSYFEAGETYYLSIRSSATDEISLIYKTDKIVGKVSQDGKQFTINVNGIPNGVDIVLALYNGKKFVGWQHATYTGNEINFSVDEAYTNAKVMVWDDLATLKPVCYPEILK